ncbi:uncharacterized protein LOC143431373 isoform X2 [Xylocopa sonorina]|uniref:uncharacterized protein LOC143431373 isoform X2 n=1 Tax=Xylocopa sonorina TaxID=1818115 RepID=UPI00403AC858
MKPICLNMPLHNMTVTKFSIRDISNRDCYFLFVNQNYGIEFACNAYNFMCTHKIRFVFDIAVSFLFLFVLFRTRFKLARYVKNIQIHDLLLIVYSIPILLPFLIEIKTV